MDRFQLLSETIPVQVWTALPDGKLDYVTEQTAQALGVSAERILKDGWKDIVHPEDLPLAVERWTHALRTGETYTVELRLKGADGAYAWYLARAVAQRGDAGAIVRWFGTNTNIEEHRRDADMRRRFDVERAILLDREQRAHRDADLAHGDLFSRFMQAPIPVCILEGPEHTHVLANPEYMALVGNGRALLGMSVREAFPELEGKGFYELLDRVYATGERHVSQEAPIRLDGSREDAFITFVSDAFRGQDGRIAGIFVVAYDVTVTVKARRAQERLLGERARLLAATETALIKADNANRAKDEFLATASHELRTPLTAILGWATLLRSGARDASSFARGLETIERNARAQVKLVEDILDGSRIITGNLHLEIRSFDLVAVVQAALDSVGPAANARDITVDFSFDASAWRVHGDADRLQQVAWNLLTNALKFTSKGGRVEVRIARVDSSIELSVTDDGQGIAPDFLPHVFDRFRQADGSTTRRHGGLGLGLALVRHLVEAHGGSVRAESDGQGMGARFVVTLPVQAVLEETVAPWRPVGSSPPARNGSLPASLVGARVLVVDDERDARDLIAAVLRGQGAEIELASSVAMGLERIQAEPPTVLVSDIGMPMADGYSFIGQVRALDGPVARTPAIALTAYSREEDRRRAIEAGFDAYLAKPVEPDELVRLVAGLASITRV